MQRLQGKQGSINTLTSKSKRHINNKIDVSSLSRSLAILSVKSTLFQVFILHIQIYSPIYIFSSLEAVADRLHLQFQTYTVSWHVSHPRWQNERNQIDGKSVTPRRTAPP